MPVRSAPVSTVFVDEWCAAVVKTTTVVVTGRKRVKDVVVELIYRFVDEEGDGIIIGVEEGTLDKFHEIVQIKNEENIRSSRCQ